MELQQILISSILFFKYQKLIENYFLFFDKKEKKLLFF